MNSLFKMKQLFLGSLAVTAFFLMNCTGKLPTVVLTTECLGFDGIPFESSEIAATCCEGDPARLKEGADPEKCRGGLLASAQGENENAQRSMQMAANGIAQTAAMLGVKVDLPPPPKNLAGSPGKGNASSFAATVPGMPNFNGNRGGDSNAALPVGQNAGRGGAGGGIAGSAAGGGLGWGGGGSKGGSSGGGDSAGKAGVDSENRAMGYAAKARDGGKKDGDGNNAGVGTDAKMNLETWGEQSAANAEAGATGEAQEGTSQDPSDYFSRIKKDESLFSVVEARYKRKRAKMSE